MKKKRHWISLGLCIGAITGWCYFSPVYAEETMPDRPIQEDPNNPSNEPTLQVSATDPKAELATVKTELDNKKTELGQLESELNQKANEVSNRETEVSNAQTAVDTAQQKVDQAQKEVTQAQNEVNTKQNQLNQSSIRNKDQIDYDKGTIGFYMWVDPNTAIYYNQKANKYSQIIDPTSENDATYLKNIFEALDYLDRANQLRKNHGLNELKIEPAMMFWSELSNNQARITASQTGIWGHSGLGGPENLMSGYSDPFELWYTKEKNNYLTNNGQETGHYLNLINSKWVVTGFAVSRVKYGIVANQTFYSSFGTVSNYPQQAYTVSEFRSLFTQYYNVALLKKELATAQDRLNMAKRSLSSAQSELTSKQSTLSNAKNRLSVARSQYNSLLTRVNTCRSEVAQLQKEYDDLYAQVYPPKKYTSVLFLLKDEFDGNYPNIPTSVYHSSYIEEGTNIVMPTTRPVVSGWTFTGWVKSKFSTNDQVMYVAKFVKQGTPSSNLTTQSVQTTQTSTQTTVANNFTGLIKDTRDGKWYFYRKGKREAFTGFAKSAANGKWYFARKGILDWSFTGVAKSVENGKWYHAKKGQLDWGFTGFSKSVADGRWYFSRKGKLDWGFTGVAKSVTNGKWYFARNGRLDWGFTGVGKSVSNGKWYSVYRGKLNWYYNGGAVSSSNGRWYAVQRGQLNWNYTGWMRCHDGLFRYFYRGVA